MSTIISVAIQKGGVGKTTTVVNTAHALAEMGLRILVIDMDPQHNTSTLLASTTPYELPHTLVDLMSNPDMPMSSCIFPTQYPNLSLVSSHIDLFGEVSLNPDPYKILCLKAKLNREPYLLEQFDYIFLDTPPHLGGVFVNNALSISHYYILPVEAESYYALKGINQFMVNVNAMKSTVNPNLELLGVLITMVDLRTTVATNMVEAIRRFFGEEKVFRTMITRNTAINRAVIERKSILAYDGRTSGAKDYREFARELHAKVTNASQADI